MIRQLRPRVVITHYWEDAHPDHVAASALVDAARFWAKLSKTDMPGAPHYPAKVLYFPSMHLRLHVKPSFVLDITPYHERKIRALNCYHSQFIAGRPTTPPTIFDDIDARSRYFGWLIGVPFGEPFLSRRRSRSGRSAASRLANLSPLHFGEREGIRAGSWANLSRRTEPVETSQCHFSQPSTSRLVFSVDTEEE